MILTWPDNIDHRLILDEATKLWRKSQRKSIWFRMLNYLFRSPIPVALYIQEYSDADWTTGACKGNITGTWILDEQGFRGAEAPALETTSHWNFERFIFHVSSEAETIALTHYYSPFGGFGYIMKIQTRKGKQTLVSVKAWMF